MNFGDLFHAIINGAQQGAHNLEQNASHPMNMLHQIMQQHQQAAPQQNHPVVGPHAPAHYDYQPPGVQHPTIHPQVVQQFQTMIRPGVLANPMTYDPAGTMDGADYTVRPQNWQHQFAHPSMPIDQPHGIQTNYVHPIWQIQNAHPTSNPNQAYYQ